MDGWGEEWRLHREALHDRDERNRAEARGRRKGIKRGKELERRRMEREGIIVDVATLELFTGGYASVVRQRIAPGRYRFIEAEDQS